MAGLLTRVWCAATAQPLPGEGWFERHPLPAGYSARTRVDMAGRECEPWLFLIVDGRGGDFDAGERWLPVRYDADEAAYRLLEVFLAERADLPWPVAAGLRCIARRSTYAGARLGMAYAAELLGSPAGR